jgi:mannosyltransferase
MATSAASPARATRAGLSARAGFVVPLGLGLLAALSVLVRIGQLDAGFWIDEGLSHGIADRPLLDIPGVLRQDGSPPLYYMLLHVWMQLTGGRSETALHGLSLLFAVLTVPVAYALARSLISPRAGWIAAVLFALNPFLTQYAQEARMYALVVLLSVIVSGTFAGAFALRRGRRWTVGFAVAQTLLLYTHNWGFFLAAGLLIGFGALVVLADDRRALVREGLIAAAIVVLAYAPWLPTLIFQTLHTGAPWARPPDFSSLSQAPEQLLGQTGQYVLLIAAGAGIAALLRAPASRWRPEASIAFVLAIAGGLALVVPWVVSNFAPAFATRYLAVALGPLLLLGALGLARARGLGLAALAVLAMLWASTGAPPVKSNVREVADAVAPGLAPGDLVISTQPEQIPVLHYYLGDVDGLRWATLTGAVGDVGVTDWRDGPERLRATTPARDLEPLLDQVEPGQRVALVAPDVSAIERWKAPWTKMVRIRSLTWLDRMRSDSRFRVITVEPPNPVARPHEVSATVFVRRQPLDSRARTRTARR